MAKEQTRPGPNLGLALLRLCLGIPVVTLIVAFVVVSLTAGSFAPWWLPVHEDGERSLVATILYFEHADRELPLDLILGWVIGAAACLGLQPAGEGRKLLAWVGAGLVVIAVLLGAVATVGVVGLIENISQMHTRPEAPLRPGSHWYYHLLSRMNLFALAVSIALLLRAMTGQTVNSGAKILLMPLALFFVISVAFVGERGLLSATFTDPIYLGHQARELFTHAVVTVPLAFWACGVMASKPARSAFNFSALSYGLVLGGVAVLVTFYVGWSAISGGAIQQGQSADIRVLIFPHFFEHTLTYLVTAFTAVAVFVTFGRAKL